MAAMVQTIAVNEVELTNTMAHFLMEEMEDVCQESNWWLSRVKVVTSWLAEESNRAAIPDDGTTDIIHRVVQRGDIYPQVQFKCWKHILLELQDIPCLYSALTSRTNVTGGNVSPNRGKLRPGKELIILSDDPNQSFRLPEGEDPLQPDDLSSADTSGRRLSLNTSASSKKFSTMSMMERQAEWLKKKQEKMEMERIRQEEEKEKELTFQPKLIRRSTYSDKPKADTAPPKPVPRGDSFNNKKEENASSAANKPGPKEKTIPKMPPRAGSKKKKSIPASQTIEIQSTLLESMKSELNASMQMNTARSVSQEAFTDNNVVVDEPATPSGELIADSSEAELPAVELKSWSSSPVINGIKIDFDSSDTKARIILQDASKFDLSTMYRKTDKKAGRDGVALHMGRREDTYEEEVIAVLFDKEKVSEAEAARWWSDHEHRFSEIMNRKR
ncbi:TPA: hypothetical protein N0F65_000570 [Lagenidium giganteum]|uniref:Uncharacterized protein n=1 Tax=Lagenidium giganteum TaxID=4803 RepID=A0AAV2Z431_9STRA|nr:TPA: hypothetical protein N0F65_000570 [Lagenidium giganteum]